MYSMRLLLSLLLVSAALCSEQGYVCYQYINSNDRFYNLNSLTTADA